VFNGVLGSGEMTCLMDSTGRFSSRSDLTLSVVGEK
jgi:hypothetical protein